jgi:hypothetical protein
MHSIMDYFKRLIFKKFVKGKKIIPKEFTKNFAKESTKESTKELANNIDPYKTITSTRNNIVTSTRINNEITLNSVEDFCYYINEQAEWTYIISKNPQQQPYTQC